jgi:hypothetical protein
MCSQSCEHCTAHQTHDSKKSRWGKQKTAHASVFIFTMAICIIIVCARLRGSAQRHEEATRTVQARGNNMAVEWKSTGSAQSRALVCKRLMADVPPRGSEGRPEDAKEQAHWNSVAAVDWKSRVLHRVEPPLNPGRRSYLEDIWGLKSCPSDESFAWYVARGVVSGAAVLITTPAKLIGYDKALLKIFDRRIPTGMQVGFPHVHVSQCVP